ncbi:nuclear transport factor 2 family protein [Streptomyces sp. NBC_01390]|uniref:nuclear transport factor 2 family protein n=1 Tax=Streptomyces sp. NBC_01390 TaxID=2903850 RepID=UPI003248C330
MSQSTLQAIDAIELLKARYCRLLDTKDWDDLKSVLAIDVVVDTTALGGDLVVGASNCEAMLERKYDKAVTVHHGHMPEIALTSPSSAKAIWAMQILTVQSNGKRVLAFGHDHDTYALRGGRWLITTIKSTRLLMDES